MNAPVSQPSEKNHNLPRLLGFWDGSAILVGLVIGSGIFLTAPSIVKNFTSPTIPMLLWLAGGTLSLFGALTYAELSTVRPHTGGMYIYLRDAYGKPTAFTFGWAALAIIRPTSISAIAFAFSKFAVRLLNLPPSDSKDDPQITIAITVAVILILTAINCIGVILSSTVQKFLTALKVLALLAIVVLAFVLGESNGFSHFTPVLDLSVKEGSIIAAISAALAGVLWTYDGWNDVTYISGEIRNPSRNMPRILITSTVAVMFIYLITNTAYIYVLPLEILGNSNDVAGSVITTLIGGSGGIIATTLVMVSTFSATNSTIFTGSRVLYAMALDGLTFKFLRYKHPKTGTPVASLIVEGVLACAWVIVLPSFEDLLNYFVFTMWLFYIAGSGSIFILRKRYVEAKDTYRVPTAIPIIFIISSILIPVMTIESELDKGSINSLLVLGGVLAGYPLYFVWMVLVKVKQK
ncbi:MAG: hypothetical protein A2W23_00600 [Planctomycetes bacterium RBG_16_43_13]|nr:MAG: hypothetical protein A2W23_00600 [Planctomycetes bacterium RBG_16_43_13]